MRVFMLGWEFPPFISGGLGIAVAGIGGSCVTIVLGAMLCAVLGRSNWPGRPPGGPP